MQHNIIKITSYGDIKINWGRFIKAEYLYKSVYAYHDRYVYGCSDMILTGETLETAFVTGPHGCHQVFLVDATFHDDAADMD